MKNTLENDMDNCWMILCALMVLMMQVGFALLEAGSVRPKNTNTILFKNLLDTCIGAITFYVIGYGFAEDANGGMIGTRHFAGHHFTARDQTRWLLWYSYC
jgi:Amt family ammonium transporter